MDVGFTARVLRGWVAPPCFFSLVALRQPARSASLRAAIAAAAWRGCCCSAWLLLLDVAAALRGCCCLTWLPHRRCPLRQTCRWSRPGRPTTCPSQALASCSGSRVSSHAAAGPASRGGRLLAGAASAAAAGLVGVFAWPHRSARAYGVCGGLLPCSRRGRWGGGMCRARQAWRMMLQAQGGGKGCRHCVASIHVQSLHAYR